MRNVIPFPRPRRKRTTRPTRPKLPLRWRLSRLATWRPVGALITVAAATGYFITQPITQGAPVSAVTFHLCGHGSRLNCVVDGNTIWYHGTKIRFADINAPEVSEPKCAREAELGHRATLRLLELMNAGPFTVVRAGSRAEDRYGRKLRVIERNGRPITEALIAEGLTHCWDGRRRSWCG